MRFGPGEIAVILAVLVVVLVLFGPKRLPALGKSCAEFFKNLRHGFREVKKETDDIKKHLK